VNDANDMAAVLKDLGFTVDKIIDGNLDQMENAILRLKNRLSVAEKTYGFFFYAGHGVQSGGENYLIPVDANIPAENFLKNRAVSVQVMLDVLNDARNELNMIVLDACRDNPFSWSRSGTRGLSIVSRQPAESIVVYATSAGMRASDGEGKNGLFTSQLLKNIKTPGLDVSEVFKRTGADVASVSGRQQVPAIYNQFFGNAYFGDAPSGQAQYVPSQPGAQPLPSPPSRAERAEKERSPEAAAKLWSVGASLGMSFADPWLIGTVRGTIAPFRYSFLEIGLDMGFVSGSDVVEKSYSFYPYAQYAFFWPFSEKVGAYAGLGAGYFISRYTFAEGEGSNDVFLAGISAGVNLFSMIDISYSLRMSFSRVSNKLSVGYVYRF
jgi:hypothetical protein